MSTRHFKRPQDDERESALIHLFALNPANQNRIGIDALDEFGNPYELKSTTKSGVSTARDVSLGHLDKWRKRTWICAKGIYIDDKTFEFQETYCLLPEDLEEWFSSIENRLRAKDSLFARVLTTLRNASYTHNELDQLRYVFKRGVLLNDPNIPWSYVRLHGIRIDSEHASRLREIIGNKQLRTTQKRQTANIDSCLSRIASQERSHDKARNDTQRPPLRSDVRTRLRGSSRNNGQR